MSFHDPRAEDPGTVPTRQDDRSGGPGPRAGVAKDAGSPRKGSGRPSPELRRVLVPLALAQFICSFAGSNMNVMINDISRDLDLSLIHI